MKIELQKLREVSKYVRETKHPYLDLIVWNYNYKCQIDSAWDEFTMLARGLITDLEGNVVARPLKKFFNLNERDDTKWEVITQLGKPKIYEKLDGSLGIQYYDGDIPQISTRGSFTSDQAKWASEWIETRYTKDDFLDGYTYLYEIIYPENRIVVDYGERAELVLLAIIETETGREVDHVTEANKLGLSHAKPILDPLPVVIESLPELMGEEGYVALYPSGFRVKIKSDNYIALHKLITQTTNKTIWECLKNSGGVFLADIPLPTRLEEWISSRIYEIRNNHSTVSRRVHAAMKKLQKIEGRKDQALFLADKYNEVKHIVFAQLDGKPTDPLIWEMVKPKTTVHYNDVVDMDNSSDFLAFDINTDLETSPYDYAEEWTRID